MKKVVIIIAVILLAGGGIAYYFISKNKYQPPQWKTAIVDTGNVTINVTATGTLNAVTVVQVGAQVSGIISRIFVDFNSVVKKGQVIALLDTTLLYSTMRDAAAGVQKARVQVALTQRQYFRADTLYKEKVLARADYDLAYSSYESAKADLQAMTATLDHARTTLKYTTIKAPINGTVISRNVDVGQTVISSFNAPTLFTIANDLSQMQVLANVDEADIGQVKVGQQTIFSVDAFPYDVFKGQVAMVRLQPVVVQNVNNYIVVINVPNPDLKLLPGLTANVVINVLQHDHVARVPVSSIHFSPSAEYLEFAGIPDATIAAVAAARVASNEIPRPGKSCFLWIIDGDLIRPVRVQVGIFDGSMLEVSGSIKAGDTVVTGTEAKGKSNAPATSNNPFMPKMPNRKTLR